LREDGYVVRPRLFEIAVETADDAATDVRVAPAHSRCPFCAADIFARGFDEAALREAHAAMRQTTSTNGNTRRTRRPAGA
jgi:hypothetical protein